MNPSSQTTWALAIETSNPAASGEAGGPGVALAKVERRGAGFRLQGGIIVERLRTGASREDDLLPAIDRITRAQGVQPRHISLVAASIGPGGFTALRVSVTVAKLIAFSGGGGDGGDGGGHQVGTCVGVPSAAVAAMSVQSSSRFAVLLASKGESAFATVFDPAWNAGEGELRLPEGRLVTEATWQELGADLLIADGHLVPAIRAAAEAKGIPIATPVFDAGACLRLALRLPAQSPETLLPLYPREPEAVTLWNKRHGA